MSRSRSKPLTERDAESRRQDAQDQQILRVMRLHSLPMNSRSIARATSMGEPTVRGRLTVLHRLGAIRRLEIGANKAGEPLVMWQPVPIVAPATPRIAMPVRPYRVPRPTIVPVRSGGAIAPVIADGANVGMGHWSHNPFAPTQDALR